MFFLYLNLPTTPNELVEIRELDNNINDAEFAETAAKRLIELIEGK